MYFIVQKNCLSIFPLTFFCLFNSSYTYFIDYSELIWFWSYLIRNKHIQKSWKLLLYNSCHRFVIMSLVYWEWDLNSANGSSLSLAIPQSADPDMKSLRVQTRWSLKCSAVLAPMEAVRCTHGANSRWYEVSSPEEGIIIYEKSCICHDPRLVPSATLSLINHLSRMLQLVFEFAWCQQ